MYYGIYSLLNGITRSRSCSGVPRGCVNIVRLWPLRRGGHSGVLIGAGETRCSDWSARMLANDEAPESIRDKWQLVAITLT